ncbi:Os11g0116200 [Oryza sativa Japonica Group]|uniref:Os11g0116200 protein n=2 Tax=Oryza TaxID=4527 RepID=A0A0P0XYB8_ORYSJ|nr:hypothetical protein DAI22_11g008000 [Oryza sativa Japonica Group]BAT12412.1 Os11g0116200 [Oryza sativa Japonica Group]
MLQRSEGAEQRRPHHRRPPGGLPLPQEPRRQHQVAQPRHRRRRPRQVRRQRRLPHQPLHRLQQPAMRRLGDVVEAPALVLTPASMQQAGGRGSSGALDASMVVILAALLCVVICALGLTSLIRCALHCARGLSPTTATPTPSVSTAATAGLKKTELRRIPVEVYGAKQAGVPDGECAICLGDFADGDKVRVLPRCHHGFHVRCIDTWLAAHTSCPTCRDSILSVHGVVAGGQT